MSFYKYPQLVEPRTAYNYDVNKESELTGLLCLDDSLTTQSGLEEADINTIVNRFLRTGELPENPQPPQYGDFDEIFDFQSAQNAVRAATAGFMAFPAHLRDRFSNDPQRMLHFLADPNNRDEAIKLGLVKSPPAPDVPPVPPADPPKP